MHWLNIYNKSNLPVNGWIQQCFTCYAPTSKTQEYKKDEYTHTVYLCGSCQNEIEKCSTTKQNYITKVNEYIHLHAPMPYAVPKISLSPPKIHATPPLLPRPHNINKTSIKKKTVTKITPPPKLYHPKKKSITRSIFKNPTTTISKFFTNLSTSITHTPDEPKPPDPLSPPSPNSEVSVTNFISMG